MRNIYIYPKIQIDDNPYIKNLEKTLSAYYRVVNKSYNKKGVLNILKYFFQTDAFFFNWIENLAIRSWGGLQIIIFIFILACAKCFKKKIIWTLHNKYSHYINKGRWIDFMYYLMLSHSDLIITHSQSGVNFIKEKKASCIRKTVFLFHPVENTLFSKSTDIIYDFLIWGDIYPYKGVAEFLKYLKDTGNEKSFKILIVGRCSDIKYQNEINKYLSSNIVHLDKFYEIDEIAKFAKQSKFTLFTYKSKSFLSSGSLIESIRMGSAIIGPNIGSFSDLNSYSFIKTYNSYDEIANIYKSFDYNRKDIAGAIETFCYENNWSLFGEKLYAELSKVI